LGRLLGRTTSAWGDTWRSVVGGSVAAYSVCLGPNDTGDLRVMVRTLSDRDELVAREEDVLSSWNTWAERHGGPQAKALVCWVREASTALPNVRAPGVPAPIEERWLDLARADVPAMADPTVREAVVAARARSLRRRDHDDSAADSNPVRESNDE